MIEQEIKHSSQINKAGYDTDKKELYIHFTRGAVYIYDAPADEYLGIIKAHNASHYFNERIKDKFKFKKQ